MALGGYAPEFGWSPRWPLVIFNQKAPFSPLFGGVSAGMTDYLAAFLTKIKRIFDRFLGGYAPDYAFYCPIK
jgi:hypothetical protein